MSSDYDFVLDLDTVYCNPGQKVQKTTKTIIYAPHSSKDNQEDNDIYSTLLLTVNACIKT